MSIVPASKKSNVLFQIPQLTKSFPWSQRYLSLDFFVSSVEKKNKQTNKRQQYKYFTVSVLPKLQFSFHYVYSLFLASRIFLLAHNVGPTYRARNDLARSRFYQ